MFATVWLKVHVADLTEAVGQQQDDPVELSVFVSRLACILKSPTWPRAVSLVGDNNGVADAGALEQELCVLVA